MADESNRKLGARAIDVGYFNVKYTLGPRPGGSGHDGGTGTGLFPALAPMLKTHGIRTLADAPAAEGCTVAIGGVSYFVGHGAVHNSKGMEPRPVSEDYALSDKYLALLRGALHCIARDAGAASDLEIECLVLGLPLNTYHRHQQRLGERASGEHVFEARAGDGPCRVVVRQARVVVQPAGALISFGVRGGRMKDGVSLVVDAGGGTLDWYLTSGSVPNLERSGAYPKAMLECAFAVADRINGRWRDQFAIVNRIDQAMRERAPGFNVQGRSYRLADYAEVVDKVVEESVNQMLSAVGSTDDIDQLLLTGGGAALFGDHLLRRLPQLAAVTRLDPDPVFSNVRGFQVAGEHYLQTARR